MIEIQVYNDSLETYQSLDLFGDEGVDFNAPIFPFTDLDDRLTEYTDSFSIPRTDKNTSLIQLGSEDKYKARLKNNNITINGFLSVKSESIYTPDEEISVYFISKVKYALDKMKDTSFSELFNDNSITGAPDIFRGGTQINDGEYGFRLNESILPFDDGFMALAANNHVSDEYTGTDFPIYAIDSKMGSRSLQPTFNLGLLLTNIFKHFDQDLYFDGTLVGAIDYTDAHIKIPTNFLADGTTGLQDRTYDVQFDGLEMNYVNSASFDGSIFKVAETINDELYITPQHNVKYMIKNNGAITISNIGVKLIVSGSYVLEIDDPPVSINEEIPVSEVSWEGSVYPALGIYKYDELVKVVEISDTDMMYNIGSITDGAVEDYFSVNYGDAISIKFGYKADKLVITSPSAYDVYLDDWYSPTEKDVIDGFFTEEQFLEKYKGRVDISYNGFGAETSDVYTSFSLETPSSVYQRYTLTPSEQWVEARYGDYVNMYQSYISKDLKMYDLVMMIIKRFNLTIKETDSGDLQITKEGVFYQDNYIIIDQKVEKKIIKTFKNNDIRYVSLLNENYGNINDRISITDNDGDLNKFDVVKYDVNKNNFETTENKYGSSLQNTGVFGDRLSVDEIDEWDFLKLENNAELWNASSNEKIETKDLPITFGSLNRYPIEIIRFPRSVLVNDENYPNSSVEALSDNSGNMVVEHKAFKCTSDEMPVLSYEDDFDISDSNGGLDVNSEMYIHNFKEYFERVSSDSVNIECNAYLTLEEVNNLRNGYKIYLFGETYKPIEVNDIKFEKDGGICTILMTKETQTQDAITFDSSTITLDSTAYTMDNN